MNELPNETWTSAYLDGELTADEQSAFEAWLADNPAAQQLLDELRSASQALRSLSRESLGPEFAASVLRQAERAVLLPQSGGDHRPPGQPARAADREKAVRFDWARWSRPLAWSALASAAALLIVVFSPESRDAAPIATTAERGSPTRELAERAAGSGEVDPGFFAAPEPGGDHLTESSRDSERFGKEPAAGAVAKGGRMGLANESPPLAKGGERLYSEASASAGLLDRNLIVVCEVTPRAVQQQYFTQVLTKNSVTIENVSLTSQADSDSAAISSRAIAKDERLSPARKGGGEGEHEPKAAESDAAAKPVAEQTVYLVEASHQQLADVLAELQNDHREVLTVNVDPAPQIPAQQQLSAYSRDGNARLDELGVPPPVRAVEQSPEQPPAATAGRPVEVQLPPRHEPGDASQQTVPAAVDSQPRSGVPYFQQPAAMPPADTAQRAEQSNVDFHQQQNLIRRQIPVEEQKAILSELEDFSNAPRAGQRPDIAGATSRDAPISNGRARQLDLNLLPRIDTVQSLSGYSAVTQDARRGQPQTMLKSATGPPVPAPSGGGSPPKETFTQRQDSRSRLGAAVTPQSRPAVPAEQQSAGNNDKADIRPTDQAAAREPLVKAVFVIQARQQVVEPSAAPVPADEEPPVPNASPE